jgi:hypothetical protein
MKVVQHAISGADCKTVIFPGGRGAYIAERKQSGSPDFIIHPS